MFPVACGIFLLHFCWSLTKSLGYTNSWCIHKSYWSHYIHKEVDNLQYFKMLLT